MDKTICFLLAVLLSGCATIGATNSPDELARTLDGAIVAIPALYLKSEDSSDRSSALYGYFGELKDDLAKKLKGKKVPLVIYMHGCAGRVDHLPYGEINFLVDNNYPVLAPDSFARNHKPTSCSPKTRTGGFYRGTLRLRLAEARNAHETAKTLPWVDQRNIFMMGFSEGGITTAKYGHGGLAGRIILGWTCHSRWPEYEGISGPRDEPILTVFALGDPWWKGVVSSNCAEYIKSRPNSESILIDISIHRVHALREIQEKILQFLEANRRP